MPLIADGFMARRVSRDHAEPPAHAGDSAALRAEFASRVVLTRGHVNPVASHGHDRAALPTSARRAAASAPRAPTASCRSDRDGVLRARSWREATCRRPSRLRPVSGTCPRTRPRQADKDRHGLRVLPVEELRDRIVFAVRQLAAMRSIRLERPATVSAHISRSVTARCRTRRSPAVRVSIDRTAASSRTAKTRSSSSSTRQHAEAMSIFAGLSPAAFAGRCRTPAGAEMAVGKWLRAMIEHEVVDLHDAVGARGADAAALRAHVGRASRSCPWDAGIHVGPWSRASPNSTGSAAESPPGQSLGRGMVPADASRHRTHRR